MKTGIIIYVAGEHMKGGYTYYQDGGFDLTSAILNTNPVQLSCSVLLLLRWHWK